jgi:hypothetical protein
MKTSEFWIENGRFVPRPLDEHGLPVADKILLHRRDMVKIENSMLGTTIKWVSFSANWASLMLARQWIKVLEGPFRLKFFNSGWFSETMATAGEAGHRIDRFVAIGDIKLSARVYTQAFDPNTQKLPPSLKKSWEAGEPPENETVICSVNFANEMTQVEHVGPKSALASVWGISPVTYPCISGHTYDRIVSKSYFEVARTGRPHHDHVVAAMTQPDGEVQWFSYQRLVFPGGKNDKNQNTVKVISEGAPVDIRLL